MKIDLEALRKALLGLAKPETRTDCNERKCSECSVCLARASLAQLEAAKRAEAEAWVQAGEPVSGMLIGEAQLEAAKGQPTLLGDGWGYSSKPGSSAQTCPECDGRGEWEHPHNGDWKRCTPCNGTGKVGEK